MSPGSSWSLARASQSQVQAGASAVIQNCVRNQARQLGGTASHISEHYVALRHGRSNISEVTMGCLMSGSGYLTTMKYLGVRVTEECNRTLRHPANGFWIICVWIWKRNICSGLGATRRRRCIYPTEWSHVSPMQDERIR